MHTLIQEGLKKNFGVCVAGTIFSNLGLRVADAISSLLAKKCMWRYLFSAYSKLNHWNLIKVSQNKGLILMYTHKKSQVA